MNANEDHMKQLGYDKHLMIVEGALKRIFGAIETLFVCDMYQFYDYSKYVSDLFDPVKKAERREEIFPIDCEKAFNMGTKLVESINS